ncbi:MAG: nuclease-related domain-containing protein, partial [Rhodoglobus sp.]|nr:nuclease-related domain-containing protein [Rhodoglobus sp.]
MTDLLMRGAGGRAESGGSRADAVPTLHVRGAAYSVIAECLRIQADARRQSLLARVFGCSPLSDDARGWYRAALGQIQVVRALRTLGSQWTLLHPEPGTSESDYLAIGSGGVVMVTIKNHSGQRVLVDAEQLLVNGRRTNHLRDARFEAERLSKLLSTEASESITVNPL